MRRGVGLQIAVVMLTCALMGMIPSVSSVKIRVGGNGGIWGPNINYTNWLSNQSFHLDDWLFFMYDRNQIDVVEVNKTSYDNCTTAKADILVNCTTGAGRDVVHLNQTRPYFFTTTKGYCFAGMKLAVNVTAPPPPPSSPVTPKSDASRSTFSGLPAIPSVLVVGAVWDAFLPFFL